jgi:hypothetical protein
VDNALLWLGRVAGVVGVLLCAVAVVTRVTGNFWLGGYQAGTLLLAGSATMIAGCLCLLWVLTERSRKER